MPLPPSYRVEDAELAFRQALRMDPAAREAAYVHLLLGKMLAEAGQLDSAKIEFDDALECDDEYGPAHYNLGRLLHRLGHTSESVGHFDKCLDLDPSDNDARRALTMALSDLDRPEEAISHVKSAIQGTEDAMAINAITLAFKQNSLEKEFQSRRARRSSRGTRFLLLMGMVQQMLLIYYEVRSFPPCNPAAILFHFALHANAMGCKNSVAEASCRAEGARGRGRAGGRPRGDRHRGVADGAGLSSHLTAYLHLALSAIAI
jgi:tetratricopeptide (TPR) repeat protein